MTHKLKTETFSQKIEYSGGIFFWPLTPLFSFVTFHLKCTVKTLIRRGIRPLQADLSLRWAHMPVRWFCHDAAQIKAELFLEMTQWKKIMSAFCLLGYKF